MNGLESLIAVEEIKSLKARYCRCIDTRDWDGWRACFVPEMEMISVGMLENKRLEGVNALTDFSVKLLAGATTVHQVHNPEINLVSNNEACGIWALHDILKWKQPNMFGFTSFVGFGHYVEDYRRIESGWRIVKTVITHFYVEQE